MNIVLHIGMPKAGSTALQSGMIAIREPLSAAGVLFPKGGGRISRNHQILMFGSTSVSHLPRWLLHKYGGDPELIGRDLEAWLSSLKAQIDATRPHTLILSAEALFNVVSEDGLATLGERLRRLGDHVEVVAYVRRPSDFYLSMAQQLLKASDEVPQPHVVGYRPMLEGYAKLVANQTHVIKYDRAAWPGGSIMTHFLQTFVPDANDVEVPPLEANRSHSAEGMAILAQYRRELHPGKANRFTRDTSQLARALRAADPDVDGAVKPQLHENVCHAIDHNSVDLLWLRDEHGIIFDGVDYDHIGNCTDPVPAAETVEDICPVDSERKELLALHAMYSLARRVTANSSAPPRRQIQEPAALQPQRSRLRQVLSARPNRK